MQYILPELRDSIEKGLPDYIVSKDIMNAGGREKNNHFQIRKSEEWGTGRYDFHYEIQQNKKDPNVFYIRIDCHFNPYEPHKNRAEYIERYGEADVWDRLDKMREIGDMVDETVGRVLRRQWRYNSLWAAKWDLSIYKGMEQVEKKVLAIIRDTTTLIDRVNKD